MKKNKRSNIILILVFLIGLIVLLYPTISDYINQFHATHAISGYVEKLGGMSKEEEDTLRGAAQEYNKKLEGGRFIDGASSDPEYQSLLNVTGDGMMGYVEIKKLKVDLPIYHGTSESILQHSIGHLEGSSLPVGGTGSHAVLTGHRGLPSAKLFTDLDQMEVGDTFTVNILNETLTYEVDKISIVLPEDVTELLPDPEQDYITLVTCTPYAVNTHRLLVRGVRIDGPSSVHVAADAIQIDPMLVAPAIAAPILVILLICLLVGTGKTDKRKDLKKKDSEKKKESEATGDGEKNAAE